MTEQQGTASPLEWGDAPAGAGRDRVFLPSELADDHSFAKLSRFYSVLPQELSTFWGFECRLGESAAESDVLFEIKQAPLAMRYLRGEASSPLDALCEQSAIWKAIRRFGQRWSDPQDPYHRLFHNIWLELDASSVDSPEATQRILQTPCLFWGPDPSIDGDAEAFDSVIEAVSCLPDAVADGDGIRHLLATLPGKARIFQIGVMASRESPVTRVCVQHIHDHEIPGWLRTLGLHAEADGLEPLLEVLKPLHGGVSVGLSLTPDGIDSKIGLECYQDYAELDPSQWAPLLDYLSELGLCLADKRRGVEAFPGMFRRKWEDAFDNLEHDIIYPLVHRNIHHLKLSVLQGDVVGAKAYLGVYRPGIQLQEKEGKRYKLADASERYVL